LTTAASGRTIASKKSRLSSIAEKGQHHSGRNESNEEDPLDKDQEEILEMLRAAPIQG
jgi:general stress protein YciG